ncbi:MULTISPECIES: hypothetical protein [Polaromonas]|uniref:Uncharacterized protein n=1 Tax=Polaromonas aquatica TaxID=332657 RepID=A0ABW1TYY7_9BURK
MKLDSFEVVYSAANELFLKGESLVCEGAGATVVVRHIETAGQEIEVMYFNDGTHNHQTKRFNASNYPTSGLAQMQVASRYLPLLSHGDTYGK